MSAFRPRLKSLLEDPTTKPGQRVAIAIQVMIVGSLACFCFETLPDLTQRSKAILGAFEILFVVAFTVEYVARLLVADRKIQFACSFFGVIDLLSILPFYLSLGVDLRSLRAFRLLRLFRILKLTRYSKAVQRFHLALKIAKEELILYLTLTIIILFLSAVGIYHCENESQPETFSSVFASMWWAVATLTTVGYGDVYPITLGGKLFTALMLLVGLGIVAIPPGIVSSALNEARKLEEPTK